MAENRRVRMTKAMMKDALLELLEERPLEKISVTDVCRGADVNRSTFYAYYGDLGQLLTEIEDDVLAQLPCAPASLALDADQRFLAASEEFFRYVQSHQRLFRGLILQRDSSRFSQRLLRSVMETYRITAQRESDPLLDRYRYIYCVSGVIGILREWLSGGFPISPEQFARLALEMSSNAAG